MTDSVLLIMLEKAFKSVNNFKTDAEIIKAYDFIIGKANQTLTISIIGLQMSGQELTEKRIKKEKNKISLNLKIEKEVIKHRDLFASNETLNKMADEFLVKVSLYKKILKVVE